jgi:hypothetical protein
VQKHNKIIFNKIIGPTFNFKITYIHHHSCLTSYRLLDDLKKIVSLHITIRIKQNILNELCARTYATSDDLFNGVDRIFETSTSYYDHNLQVSHILCILETKNTIVKLQNKVETMEAPQNKSFYEKMECLTFWPTYVHERGRTLGKTYGIKARCYWDHPREHIGELDGNMLGTKTNEKDMSCKKHVGKKIGTHPFLVLCQRGGICIVLNVFSLCFHKVRRDVVVTYTSISLQLYNP